MAAPSAAPSAERWAMIAPIVDRALDLNPEDRARFLAEACSHDPELLRDVERVLKSGEADDTIFARPAAAFASRLVAWAIARGALAAGDRIGAYVIDGELGRGGMATVYLARDVAHGQSVALKVLRPEVSDAVGGRFAREIAITARLTHPHILSLIDSGAITEPGAPPVVWYTMPYVAGRSLRHRLRDEGPLSVTEAVAIARQVADALDYAHREGIIHRDIKPENILLAEDGARVADFGIARALDAAGGERLTQTGLALGTPAYMSPEQGSGDARLDGRADVYALGCVLYEMLAGEPPFTGSTAQAVLARHAKDEPPSLRTVCREVSPRLDRAVRRALAKVPADRQPTAGAFAEAIEVATREYDSKTQSGDYADLATATHELHNSRRRALAALAAAFVIGIAIAVKARSTASPTANLDPAVVAVAPFRITAPDSSLAHLREGIVDLLATKLGGTLVVRPVDSRTLLNTWRGATRGGAVSESRALALAIGLSAGRLIEGGIAQNGSRVTLSAVILEVPDGRRQSTASVEGPVDSVSKLVDGLAVRLLVRAAREPQERWPDLDARPLPVIREYLNAWENVRHFHFEPVVKTVNQLLAADSNFALAALALASTDWDGDDDGQRKGVLTAWPLRNRLTPRDQAYLESLAGSGDPSRTRPREQLAALERYTRIAPSDPLGWAHYSLSVGEGALFSFPEDAKRSKAAAARVLELDPSMWEVNGGFAELAAHLRDTVGMTRGLRAIVARDSTSPGSVFLQWEVATSLGDTAAARRAALNDSMVSARADSPTNGPVWDMGRFFLREGLGGRDLDLIMKRSLAVGPTDRQQRDLLHRQYMLAMIRGRADGMSVADWWDRRYAEFWYVLAALFMDGDPKLADSTAPALLRRIGNPRSNPWGCCYYRFAAAEYALAHGDTALARRAWRELTALRARGDDSARSSETYRGWAAPIAAQLAAGEGEPASTERLRELDSMLLVDPPPGGLGEVATYAGLISARLHEQRREFGAALAAIRHRNWNSGDPIIVTYHREEGRIAAEAGDTAGAIRAYERFLRIRADAETRLEPQIQQVRAALTALRRPR